MSDTSTSIGPGPTRGGNENKDGDPRNKTLGEAAPASQPPEGAGLLDAAAPPVPAGVPGAPAEPDVGRGADVYPDGPNVEASPWELDAARGEPPRRPDAPPAT